jgi:iron complex transport system substrate-binding protein
MPPLRLLLSAALFAAGLGLPMVASAAVTHYPLTIQNCGREETFTQAPQRVVSLGQSNTETLLSLGLAKDIVGTAVWFGPVLPQYAAVNSAIKRLANNDPSFEAVVAQSPDLVTAQYEWHVGPHGVVGTRDQFEKLGIRTYIAPSDCVGKDNSGGGDGVRTQPFTMDLVYQEIRDDGAIFNIPANATALIASLKTREENARHSVGETTQGLPVLFWFSSRQVTGDAFVAGNTGAPAYMIRALGARNVITTDDEWPTISWERIAQLNPAVIVLARMDRRRFPADDVAVKLHFLETDPVASQIAAVRNRRFVIMDAVAMNPSIRTVDGIETLAQGIRSVGLTK